jgi:hypothetical protein
MAQQASDWAMTLWRSWSPCANVWQNFKIVA